MKKRELEVVVLSDLHLGTYGCHAREIVQYLKSINPRLLILNGDIIDGWQFSKRFFPASHLQVIKEILALMQAGTRIFYITGNHDEMLRRYSGIEMGNFCLADKLVIELNGKKVWIFHGDVFDNTTKGGAKILAKLGGYGYDWLILLNRLVNWLLVKMGRPKISLSKKIKNSVKKAVSFIADFETTAAELAIENNYQYVICGHIHQPQIRTYQNQKGRVIYMNSGDWIENLTSLEFNGKDWSIYRYDPLHYKELKQNFPSKTRISPEVITQEIGIFLTSLNIPVTP